MQYACDKLNVNRLNIYFSLRSNFLISIILYSKYRLRVLNYNEYSYFLMEGEIYVCIRSSFLSCYFIDNIEYLITFLLIFSDKNE